MELETAVINSAFTGSPPSDERRPMVLRLAQNVAISRQRAGLTQLQLAVAADLSRATVHLIEAGACDPKLSTVVSLARALQIKTLSLLFDDLKTAPRSSADMPST